MFIQPADLSNVYSVQAPRLNPEIEDSSKANSCDLETSVCYLFSKPRWSCIRVVRIAMIPVGCYKWYKDWRQADLGLQTSSAQPTPLSLASASLPVDV